MARVLDQIQEKELIDFLKRWGIDHPELLAEMADHYAEKALAEMASGKNWDQVLADWKTKETFRALRKIQKAYEDQYPELWRKTQWKIAKSVLFDVRKGGILFLLLILLMVIWSFPMGGIILHKVFILKASFSILVMLYSVLNKRIRNILTFRNFGFYFIFNSLLWQAGFGEYLESVKWEWLLQPADILDVLALWVAIVIDVVAYKIWLRTKAETSHLTDQMLKEHIPHTYQNTSR